MRIGVIGGGFKPPHKGHYNLAKKALQEIEGLDQLNIYVGGKKREGISITQEQSIRIWKEYARTLPGKVEVFPAEFPIGAVYSAASKNPMNEVYWTLGIRDTTDREEVERRKQHLVKNPEKYPNLKVVELDDLGIEVSGTALRQALLEGNKTLALEMLPKEVDQQAVLDIIMDTPENRIGEAIDNLFETFIIDERVDFKRLEKVLDDMFEDLDLDINFTRHFKERVIERGLTEDDIIELMEKIHDNYPDEVADLEKGENRVFSHIRNLTDIAAVSGGYSSEDYMKDLILKTAYKRNSEREPEFRTNASSPKLKVVEASGGTPITPLAAAPSKDKALVDNRMKYFQNLLPSDMVLSRVGMDIVISLAKYAEGPQPDTTDYTAYQVPLPESIQSEFDFVPHIASILGYCMDRGMVVDPIPEVKILQDPENASNLFGKTAYYDPQNKEIALYVTDRHPKDVLRSFCHELIHHIQNLEGRNLSFTTSNIHDNEELKEIEQEAHAKGSFLFRDWENSNKEQEVVSEDKKKVLSEGQYDALTTFLTKKSIAAVKNALIKKMHHYKEGYFGDPSQESTLVSIKKVLEDTYPVLLLDIPEDIDKEFQKETGLEFDYELKVMFVKGLNRIMRDGGAYKGGFGSDNEWEQPKLEVEFVLDPYNFPGDFEELSSQLTDVIRHEMEHLTQAGGNEKDKSFGKDAQFGGKFGTEEEKEFRNQIAQGVVDNGVKYLTLPSEIDANIQGLYLSAKKQKRPFEDLVDQYLYAFTEQFDEEGNPYLTTQDVEDVKKTWALRLPALGIKQKL